MFMAECDWVGISKQNETGYRPLTKTDNGPWHAKWDKECESEGGRGGRCVCKCVLGGRGGERGG